MSPKLTLVFALACCVIVGCRGDSGQDEWGLPPQSESVHAFYYAWYGNPDIDGAYSHWNHEVLVSEETPRFFSGGDDIGANFYPQLGCYSSNDPAVIEEHMRQVKRAGVGVLCVSWWGERSFSDHAIPKILDLADLHGIKINFHLEPFPGRNAKTSREALIYLMTSYGDHPAFHRLERHGNLPIVYVYDSYLTSAEEWATILAPNGERTIRGTPYDAVMIGLWVQEHEEEFMTEAHFDGFYTYFATDGFTYGSTASNWERLAGWARENEKTFIPCVGPGYLDSRIRPWNTENSRSRDEGTYYDRMFKAALDVAPEIVGVTSFNEWHEGTQIEPAVPEVSRDYTYEDYRPLTPEYYLDRTRYWVEQLETGRDH